MITSAPAAASARALVPADRAAPARDERDVAAEIGKRVHPVEPPR
jgi:hypothetical protein